MSLSLSISAREEGFTAIPRPLFDLLLCLPLSKRDLSILLLVARLTYGCRNRTWAQIKQADLSAIGIGPTHAKTCLKSLIERKFLMRNEDLDAYRLGEALLTDGLPPDTLQRLEHLGAVVGRQLGKSYHSGKSLPQTVTSPLPNREHSPYQNGNMRAASGWSFSPSTNRFEKTKEYY